MNLKSVESRTMPVAGKAIAEAVMAGLMMLSCLVPIGSSLAEGGKTGNGTANLLIENDMFGGNSDRNYTHGTRLSWLSDEGDVPDWVREAALQFPLFPIDGRLRAGYALGQNIYTPENISEPNLITSDRPYAGWLYVGVGMTSDTGARLDNLELDIGVVGPASLAGRAQRLVHRVIDSPMPRGWSNQLHNEPGIVLNYERKWRNNYDIDFHDLGFDFTPHIGASIGNIYTLGAVGGTIRFGHDLPADYGPPRIRPALPGSSFFKPTEGLGWYFFLGIEGRAVARNIFLDGNTFRDSHRVDKKLLVGDLQAGIAVTYGPARVAYTQVFRTREFETQGSPDSFGAINLTVQF